MDDLCFVQSTFQPCSTFEYSRPACITVDDPYEDLAEAKIYALVYYGRRLGEPSLSVNLVSSHFWQQTFSDQFGGQRSFLDRDVAMFSYWHLRFAIA